MESRYPRDGTEYMNKDGPTDPRFQIPDGKLLYNEKCDAHLSLIQLSIIDIFRSNSRPSIMFLDNVWETYRAPFSTIFRKWDIRRSKPKLDAELEAFKTKFSSHPFATPGSLEFQKLKYLDRLIQDWMKNYTPANEPDQDMVGQFAGYF